METHIFIHVFIFKDINFPLIYTNYYEKSKIPLEYFKIVFLFLTKYESIDFRERKSKRERNINVRETLFSCLPCAPQPGVKLTTQVCAPTRNRTCRLLGDDAPTDRATWAGLASLIFIFLSLYDLAAFSWILIFLFLLLFDLMRNFKCHFVK